MDSTSIRKDFFRFLKRPNYERFENIEIKDKIIILFKVFALIYLGLIISSIPMTILKKFNIIGEIAIKSDVMYQTINNDMVDYKTYFLIFVILIVPILEEFSFRLAQVKFNVQFIIVSISLITGSILGGKFVKYLWMPHYYSGDLLIYCFYIFLFGTMIYLILNFKWIKINIKKIEDFWNFKPGLIFYSIALLFAIIHISNLNVKTDDLIYLPIILLPYFVYGSNFD